MPDKLIKRLNINQQTRSEQIEQTKNNYDKYGIDANLSNFFKDIALKIADTDLIIARSGASTISEITCIGRPAILVPYKYATENHQMYNAKALEDAKGAILIEQKDLRIEILSELIADLMNNNKRLTELAQNSHKLLK